MNDNSAIGSFLMELQSIGAGTALSIFFGTAIVDQGENGFTAKTLEPRKLIK
ncbi:hypothetical protein [Candidatus Competibacter phosphatis]|uniref:hypothetical protein n=1 Tax=Candidatus Competibacter phosphatis TaxID=221280 RepID=UPI001FE75B38|nr:hypothetical protein [Candidatus Competibacter phosphatis]